MKVSIFFFGIALSILAMACGKDKNNTPPPPGPTASYKDSAFTAVFRQTSGLVASDGALSIDLGNGKSLWLMGDSYIDNFDAATGTVPCLFQVRNAGFLLDVANPAANPQTLLGSGSPKSYFALGSDNNYWFWPGCGYRQGDTAYVYLERLHLTGGSGSFAFENVDTQYVGKVHIPTMAVAGYYTLGPQGGIHWVHGTVEDGGFRYIYGTRANGFGEDVLLSRQAAGNIYAPREYYTGSGWSNNISDVQKLKDEFTSSFHVSKVNGKYVMLTTEFSVDCNQGKEIYSYTASAPQGPFGNKKTVWKVDDLKDGNYPFFYLAYAHPEYDNGKSELVISYCINGYGSCVSGCVNGRKDPDIYRPRVVRVPFGVMGL